MDSPQTGLLERLRAQRESIQGGSVASAAPLSIPDEGDQFDAGADQGAALAAPGMRLDPRERATALNEHATRLVKLEADGEDTRRRLDSIESSLRTGLNDLRVELPGIVASEISRHTTPMNEAIVELGGRVGRIDADFGRERERWSGIVTSFDQRLDQRLRSFRQDVTVMLTGMAVLVLAMLMLLLLRR